jgi:hypothetical protein
MYSTWGEAKRVGRAAAAGTMCIAALLLSSCSGETDPEPPAPITTTPVAWTQPPLTAPTPAELNANLARAFDAGIPAADKITLVQGAAADPQLIDQVVAAAKANKAEVEVVDVTDLGDGSVVGTVAMRLDGQPTPESVMNFVAEDGVWKLSQDSACGIVSVAGLTSPACE